MELATADCPTKLFLLYVYEYLLISFLKLV